MLLAFVVYLMSPLCDCALPELALGSPCSVASQCQPGPFTQTRHCCGGPPNGKYCSGCCVDSDCGPGHICIPFNWLQTGLTPHRRVCVSSKNQGSSAPCFRNEQCASMHCNGGRGFSEDQVKYPLGNCA
jgi:hypothetical protein